MAVEGTNEDFTSSCRHENEMGRVAWSAVHGNACWKFLIGQMQLVAGRVICLCIFT